MNSCKPNGLDTLQKNQLDKGEILPVMEMFYSIQGEGFNTGKAAFFIRIGGCDVGCHWCDVKESWDARLHPLTPVHKIVEEVKKYPAKAVVITGGEPLLYNLDFLCQKLKSLSISIFLETSGTCSLSGTFDWICVSPKSQLPPTKEMLQLADELKIIIHEENDFNFAISSIPFVKDKCLLYLQPEWSRHELMLPLITDFVMQNPRWMVSLQSHKYMKIP